MLLGLVAPTAGRGRAVRRARCRPRAAAVLPAVGALVEGPAFHPYLSGPAQPAPARRRRPHRRPGDGRDAGSTPRSTGSGCWPRPTSGTAPTRSACGSGSRSPRALLTPKDLLVLDEPTNGLDPQGTREVRQLVGSLAGDGTTVLVSSHLLAEVEQMCTHLGVMHVGRLVAQGSSRRAARPSGDTEATVETDPPETPRGCWASSGLTEVHTDAHHARPGHLGEVAPEKVVAALRPRRRLGARLPGRPADAGGRVRLADRGGLRCQWLTLPRRPTVVRRAAVAALSPRFFALRAAADASGAAATRPACWSWPRCRSSSRSR